MTKTKMLNENEPKRTVPIGSGSRTVPLGSGPFWVERPEIVGRAVGFADMTSLHGEWIRTMAFGDGDFTLQAHRGSFKSSCLAVAIALILISFPERNISFKSSCLAVAIALILISFPERNIIFIRKTDNDVSEMMGMVVKILRSDILRDIVTVKYGTDLRIESEGMDHLSTNLWQSPMGAQQLLGLGIRTSITGKHAYYVITDDICNLSDRISRAERERTKLQYDELQNIRNLSARCRTSDGTTVTRRD